jgi:hypothetical protein
MWIIQKPKNGALWNKQHFEEKNGECAACLKYSVLIFLEKNVTCYNQMIVAIVDVLTTFIFYTYEW